MKKEEKQSTITIIKQLFGHFRNTKMRFAIVLFLVLTANILELIKPTIIGRIIDNITLASSMPEKMAQAALLGSLAYFGASLGAALINVLFGILRIRLEQDIVSDLRNRIFTKIQSLSHKYHDNHHSGGIITKATRDIDHVRAFFGDISFDIFNFSVITIGAFIVFMNINWKLAIACYALLIPTILLIYRAGRKLRDLFKAADDEYDGVTEILRENITGIRVVRAFGKEHMEIGKFDAKVNSFFGKVMHSVKLFSFYLPMAFNLFGLSAPVVLLYGGYMAINGQITLGELTSCMFYLSIIMRKMRMINKMVDRTQNAVASTDRLNQILNAESDILDNGKTIISNAKGRIEFKGVTFGYDKNKPILNNVNVVAEPGETVAFVGPTGSGKSTAAMLIPRFFDVAGGTITIDGVDIREMPLCHLRSTVGFVFQDPFLFSDTIRANIAYGRCDATMEDVITAAKEARIHDYIMTLKDGYDTIIGERGINLSGGQKQRLTIARALIYNPPILVFDDCTSSLDAVTEKGIRDAMTTAAGKRTRIIIAQRISTIRRADKIAVFNHGSIIQSGTHNELIGIEGVYRELFLGQSFTAPVNERKN
ncbi:MAG: ABC transporter ATP-binding protein [Fibrobacteres bacterium]|nr:ABC transporter ATP-binding protein [Fibrobacterota bacterium]